MCVWGGGGEGTGTHYPLVDNGHIIHPKAAHGKTLPLFRIHSISYFSSLALERWNAEMGRADSVPHNRQPPHPTFDPCAGFLVPPRRSWLARSRWMDAGVDAGDCRGIS